MDFYYLAAVIFVCTLLILAIAICCCCIKRCKRQRKDTTACFYDLEPLTPEECRTVAEQNLKVRDRCKQHKQDFANRHDSENAGFYESQASWHDDMYKKANQAAAKKFIVRNSEDKGLKKNCIDLHNLFVEEAVQAVKEKLQRSKDETEIKIITGRGLHSQHGVPRIKPAVESYLTENGYRFEEELNENGRRNPGCLVVDMNLIEI